MTVLVIGSTGKTGRRVARLLEDRGVAVRHGARGSAIPFDWERPETWPAALEGCTAAYVAYYPDLAAPGAEEKIAALTEAARAAGLGRLVLLAGRGEPRAEACERIVAASGLGYTLLRAAWFDQNFSEGMLRDAVLSGAIALPAGEVREPLVDVEDIAEVAAAALTEPGHEGQLYEVTGPEALGFAEAAAQLSEALGRQVVYVPISLERLHAEVEAAAGREMADLMAEICRQTLDGRNAYAGDGVQRALGRAPRSFADFCRRAAAEGAWRLAS
jgi:uncharacterized protein YbjT (DUF2867 family)